ncbi:flavodoxin family protein [Spongorhabdus nitratireducens]
MTIVAVVYHSENGHTEKQAMHVVKGINNINGVTGRLIKAESVTENPETLNTADGIIFGSPTYLGNVSARFKAFMDATSGIWFGQQWKDKVAAGFTNSQSLAGDKLATLLSLTVFAAQHGMIWIGQSAMNGSANGDHGNPEVINRTGTMLGAVAQSDDAPAEITPPAGDLKTAEMLGQRVAGIALRLHSGGINNG